MFFLDNDYWSSSKDAWTTIAAIATVFGVLVALAGAAIAGLQIIGARRLLAEANALETRRNRETAALELHRSYLLLCVERPGFSASYLMLKTLKRKNFAGIMEEYSCESEQALWFLSYMLHTMEQLFNSVGDQPNWKTTIEDQIGYHHILLAEVWPTYRGQYGEAFRVLVDRVLARNRPVAAGQA